ncbi:transposase family protein, partial [Pectobacterium cacticida]|uniref:transposase family protein n=1 Tax=Pectobacterium cacticida TaxID=69221 RepID=UPI0039875CF0
MSEQVRPSLLEVFESIEDPRQAGKVAHNLSELLVVAVSAVLSGADTFVEIVQWGNMKFDGLRQHRSWPNGIA